VILVDGTFLTGKYRGTFMMAVVVDPEQQLVPLAFALPRVRMTTVGHDS
jgi:hypothetical protein